MPDVFLVLNNIFAKYCISNYECVGNLNTIIKYFTKTIDKINFYIYNRNIKIKEKDYGNRDKKRKV